MCVGVSKCCAREGERESKREGIERERIEREERERERKEREGGRERERENEHYVHT